MDRDTNSVRESVGDNRTVTVQLPIEGYDVEVKIPTDEIEREIRRYEGCEEFALDGPRAACDLSKFVLVDAVPTDQKWKELADGIFTADRDEDERKGVFSLGR